jgi:CNT family concentrative nucleoside transporter
VPQRRAELAQLGFKAMLGGLLACYCTACVAGLLL